MLLHLPHSIKEGGQCNEDNEDCEKLNKGRKCESNPVKVVKESNNQLQEIKGGRRLIAMGIEEAKNFHQ
jgi:hypothetical protein